MAALTLDIARYNDADPVLTAAGEIDLSNIDAFSHALAAAAFEIDLMQGLLALSEN